MSVIENKELCMGVLLACDVGREGGTNTRMELAVFTTLLEDIIQVLVLQLAHKPVP